MTLIEVVAPFRKFNHYLQNRYFDWKWSTQTWKPVALHQLPDLGPVAQGARMYAPSTERLFKRSLKFFGAEFAHARFWDIGCGQGKVMMMAHQWGFQNICGVEASQKLINLAINNFAIYQSKRQSFRYQLFHADATTFDYSLNADLCDEVFYLYNPFDSESVRKFANRLRGIKLEGKGLWVIYLNPLRGWILEGCGWKCLATLPALEHNDVIGIYYL